MFEDTIGCSPFEGETHGPLPLVGPPTPEGCELGYYIGLMAERLVMRWCDAVVLVGATDRQRTRRLPSLLGLWAAEPRVGIVANRLGVAPSTVRRMLLNRWAGLLPTNLNESNGAGLLTRVRHFRLAGTAWCPSCVAAGTWNIGWRLVWVHSCTVHQRLLVYRCPACGQRGRAGSRNGPGWRPPFPRLQPTPGLCENSISNSGRCGHPLTQAPFLPAGRSQTILDELLHEVEEGSSAAASRLHRLVSQASEAASILHPPAEFRHDPVRRLHDPQLAAAAFDEVVVGTVPAPRSDVVGREQHRYLHLRVEAHGSAAANLPMLLWEQPYLRWFADLIGTATWVTRRHASTLLVRQLDQCSLHEAARRLGWAAGRGYYHLRGRLSEAERERLDTQIAVVAARLRPVLGELFPYGRARTLLAHCPQLAPGAVQALPKPLASRPQLVTAWVWAELTGAPPVAWRNGPTAATRSTPEWRSFVTSLSEDDRIALDNLVDREAARLELHGTRPGTRRAETVSDASSTLFQPAQRGVTDVNPQ